MPALLSSVARAGQAESSVQVRIDVDRDVLAADVEEHAIVKVCLDTSRPSRPENRPLVNLALALDRSGSMSGEKLAHAKEAALAALSRLSEEDVFSLVAYDTTVETLVPARRVGDGRAIERAIRSIDARGNTALFGGVSQAASEVRKNLEDRRYTPRILLISDGLANVGPSAPEDLARLGVALMKEGISVTTIGLGLGYNEDLMTRLAQCSDGNTYFVESSADLPRIFAAELGDALNVVARRVVLRITFPDGVSPKGLVGREGVVKGQSVELTLNQLYGGQEKFALVEVAVAPTARGSTKKIAEARVAYEDAISQKPATAAATKTVAFTTDTDAVVRSANLKVQADYARNAVAQSKDRAVSLADARQPAAAAAELRATADEFARMGAQYQNRELLELAKKTRADAERVQNEGLGNAARKTFRAESAQTKNQQSSYSSGGSRD